MAQSALFTGCATAMITPFKEDGSVNYEALERFTDFQTSSGVGTLLACGTTGEAATLSDDEQLEVIRCVISRARPRGARVLAGTGSNDTAHAISLSRRAEQAGADALLLVTPYYNKTSQRGLVEHYRAVAAAVQTPLIVYSVPSRTGVTIAPETYAKLAEIGGVRAVKEASGNIGAAAAAMALCGDRLDFYSGNDENAVAMMSLGAKGLISVLSNIKPARTQEMCSLALSGDFVSASRLQLGFMPLISALFCDVNPIPVKAACALLGIDAGPCRLPLCGMEAAALERLRAALAA